MYYDHMQSILLLSWYCHTITYKLTEAQSLNGVEWRYSLSCTVLSIESLYVKGGCWQIWQSHLLINASSAHVVCEKFLLKSY